MDGAAGAPTAYCDANNPNGSLKLTAPPAKAARVFMLEGEVVETGPTETIFNQPSDKLTENYVAGRFG